jgi:hypothetical protein
METIVLDYNSKEIYSFSHDKNYIIEEMENLLVKNHNFILADIEWMTVSKLEIKKLNLI